MVQKIFDFLQSSVKALLRASLIATLAIPTPWAAAEDATADSGDSRPFTWQRKLRMEQADQLPPAASTERVPGTEANYCLPNAEKSARVRPDLTTPALGSEITNWSRNLQTVYTNLSTIREELLSDGAAFQRLASVLAMTEYPMTEIRNQLAPLVSKLPAAYRVQGQNVIKNYFAAAGLRAELEQMLEPRRWSLNDLRFKYAIELAPETAQKYFSNGDESLPGVDIDLVQKNGQTVYRLAIDGETTFHSLVRSAARSPVLQHPKDPKEAYLETVRCVLGRAVLGKYSLNKTILEKGKAGQPLAASDKLCLGVTAADFNALAGRDTDVSRETLLRANFVNSIPEISTKISTSTQTFFLSSGLASKMALLSGFPDLIDNINNDLKAGGRSPIPVDAQYKAAFDEINNLINAEYFKLPDWETMRLIWRQPVIQSRLANLFDNCHFQMVSPTGQPLTIDDYWEHLMRSDDVLFLISLYSDISAVPGRWLDMNRGDLTTALRNYILAKKVEASMRSISYLVNYLYRAGSANPDEMMVVAYDDLSNALAAEFNRLWLQNPKLEGWLSGLVDKIENDKGNISSFQKMLQSFTQDLIQAADDVNKVMDPNRAPGTLPYVEKHVLEALSNSINALTPNNRRRYNQLVNETDPVKRNGLWALILNKMNEEASKIGASCKSDPGLAERAKNLLGGWFHSQTTATQKATSEDCKALTLVARAIGADRTTPPDFPNTLLSLQLKFDAGQITEFLNSYRSRLASSAMEEHRLLDLPIKDGGDTRLWQKIVRVHDADKLQPDVLQGLQKSVTSLSGYLKTLITARNEKDLSFFITRTNVINTILGQNQITQDQILDQISPLGTGTRVSQVLSNEDVGFVFPALLKYHQNLQITMVNDGKLNSELWGEFVSTNAMYIVTGVVAGWAFKYAVGALPRFTGGPALGSFIDRAGSRISYLITAHANFTLLVLFADLGRLMVAKRDFNTELSGLDMLHIADGVALADPGSPFPWISEPSFFKQKTSFQLVSEPDFFKQKLGFDQANSDATSQIWQTVGFIALPLFLGRGMKMYNWGAESVRFRWENDFDRVGIKGQQKYARWMSWMVGAKLRMLTNDFARLGNPAVDYGQLKAAHDRFWAEAKSPLAKQDIDESYNRIIIAFGRDMEAFQNYPNLKQLYAQTLYGNGGSVSHLDAIYSEYGRITEDGLR